MNAVDQSNRSWKFALFAGGGAVIVETLLIFLQLTTTAFIFYIAFGVVTLLIALVSVIRRRFWSQSAWYLVIVILFLHLAGMVYRFISDAGQRSVQLDHVSVADGAYAVAFLLGLAAFLIMISRVQRRHEILWRIDSAIVLIAIWSIGAVFIIDRMATQGGAIPVLIIQVFYLTVSATVVALGIRLVIVTKPRVNRALRFLIAASLLFIFADLAIAIALVNGWHTTVTDAVAAAANLLVMTFVAAGAIDPTVGNEPARTPHEGRLSETRTALLTFSVVVIVGVIAAGWQAARSELGWPPLAIAAIAIAALLAARSLALLRAYRQVEEREKLTRDYLFAFDEVSTNAEINDLLIQGIKDLLPGEPVGLRWSKVTDVDKTMEPSVEMEESATPVQHQDGKTTYRYRYTDQAEDEVVALTLDTDLLLDPADWQAMESIAHRAVERLAQLGILAERANAEEQARLNLLMAGSQDMVVLVDEHQIITAALGAVQDLTGKTADEWISRPVDDLVVGLSLSDIIEATRQRRKIHAVVAGRFADVEVTVTRTTGGEVTVSLHDISSMVALNHTLTYQATHDPITELPNRFRLVEMLDQNQPAWLHHQRVTSVVLLDIDDFRSINDSLGHEFGDQLLRELARRLNDHLGNDVFIARLSGDQFCVVLDRLDIHAAVEAAEQLLEILSEPLIVDGVDVVTRFSAGVATAPKDALSAESLLQAADLSLEHARTRSRRVVGTFNRELLLKAQRRMTEAHAVTTAARTDAFRFEYQPVVSLPALETIAVEALMRWDGDEDLHRPDSFIPIAESIGELTTVIRQLFPQALGQLADWREVEPHLQLTLNLHAGALMEEDLAAWMISEVERVGLPPSAVVLELSERSLVPAQALSSIRQLRHVGMEAWIDDFGTGWSNLSSLGRLPITGVKLAREIVIDHDGSLNESMLKASVALASAVGFTIVAEGVEDPDDLRMLSELGVDAVQGFGVARPMNAGQLRQWLGSTVRQR